MTRTMAPSVYDIPQRRVRDQERGHEHHAGRGVPRRRPSRGGRRDRTGDGPVRARDRPRPVRRAAAQPHPAVQRAAHHVDGCGLRRRRLRAARSTRCSTPPATTSCAPSRPAGARRATRSRWGSASAATSRSPASRSPRATPKRSRGCRSIADGAATVFTGTSPHGQGHDTSWSMIASSELGIPMDRIDVVHGDTDLVPGRRRHLRLAVAAAGRRRGADRSRSRSPTVPARWQPSCSRPTSTTSCSTRTPARSTCAARRRCRSRGASSRPRPRSTVTSRSTSSRTSSPPARPTRSARTSPSSTSTSRRARSGSCATWRATTPAPC